MAGIFDIELHDGQPENSDDEDDAIDIAEVICLILNAIFENIAFELLITLLQRGIFVKSMSHLMAFHSVAFTLQ